MAALEDLHKSISDMTDEELAERFRQIRLNRRVSIDKRRAKAKAKATPKPKASAAKLNPNNMSPEAAAELLKLLEGA